MKKYFVFNKGTFIISILATFISSCLDVGVAFVLQFIINASTTGDINNLLSIGLRCLIFMMVYAVAKCFNTVIVRKCIRNIMVQLKRDLFIGLISNNTRKFRSKNVAEYISNITKYHSQNQMKSRPIRRRSLPDIRRLRRRFSFFA